MNSNRFAPLAFCLLAGCGGDGGEMGRVCTAAACLNGLRMTLANPPSGAFRIEAQAPGETVPHAIDCMSAQSCLLFFQDYMPAQVTIRVIAGSGTTTLDATPAYGAVRPNGPDCPPECRQATVTVT